MIAPTTNLWYTTRDIASAAVLCVHLSCDNFVKKEKWNYMFIFDVGRSMSHFSASLSLFFSICSSHFTCTLLLYIFVHLYSYDKCVARVCYLLSSNILKRAQCARWWSGERSTQTNAQEALTHKQKEDENKRAKAFLFNSVPNLH